MYLKLCRNICVIKKSYSEESDLEGQCHEICNTCFLLKALYTLGPCNKWALTVSETQESKVYSLAKFKIRENV